MEFFAGEVVGTGEVAWVGETDTEVAPDEDDGEDGVDDEKGDG